MEQFRKVNGFPNAFWGWGGEDDDLWNRSVGGCGRWGVWAVIGFGGIAAFLQLGDSP